MDDTPPITRADMIDLLSWVQAVDGHARGGPDIDVWLDAATQDRWTRQESVTAIRLAGRSFTGYRLMPGHVGERIRTDRRQPESFRPLPPPLALTGGGDWPVGDDPDWGRHNLPELEAIHTACIRHPCSNCAAVIGERCRNKVTNNATKIPCLPRLKAARIGR